MFNFTRRQFLMNCKKSKRPLLFGGHGVKLSDSRNEFLELVNLLNIPLQTSWNGTDLIEMIIGCFSADQIHMDHGHLI